MRWFGEDGHLPRRYIALLAVLCFGKAAVRYVQVGSPEDLFFDAREVWYPLSQAVLAGERLYVDVPDNKPPLFQFLNLGVAATDAYVPTFLFLLGLANLATAVLVYRWYASHDDPGVDVLAAFLLVLALPVG